MIELNDLVYRDLEITELKIPEGFCAVFGPNGSGKSTLLQLLSGMELPERGTILIDGSSPRDIECGYLSEFPDKNMIFERVVDEISSPLKFRHMDCTETKKTVRQITEKLGITGLSGKNITKLSGGEKILVALATAISAKPDLLVLDEADSHLDSLTAGEIFDIIRDFQIRHVVFCTQNMEKVERTAGFAIYMENSRICLSGETSSILEKLRGTCFYPGDTEQ